MTEMTAEQASKTRLLRNLIGELQELGTGTGYANRRAELHRRIDELQAEGIRPMSPEEIKRLPK